MLFPPNAVKPGYNGEAVDEYPPNSEMGNLIGELAVPRPEVVTRAGNIIDNSGIHCFACLRSNAHSPCRELKGAVSPVHSITIEEGLTCLGIRTVRLLEETNVTKLTREVWELIWALIVYDWAAVIGGMSWYTVPIAPQPA